jgi:hypothetical protein
VIAVLNDGPEEYMIVRIDEPWEAFAAAWWNTHAYWSCHVELICDKPIYVVEIWRDSPVRDFGSFDVDGLVQEFSQELAPKGLPEDLDGVLLAERVAHRCNYSWWWSPVWLARIGLFYNTHYTAEVEPFETFTHVTVELTELGKRAALEYARDQVKEECRKAGKPLPWD